MYYSSEVYGRGKAKYSLFSNMGYAVTQMRSWNRLAFLLTVLGFIPCTLSNYLSALLPSRVVSILEQRQSIEQLLLQILLLSAFLWISNSLMGLQEQYTDIMSYSYINHFQKKYISKIMDIDYDRLEDKERQSVIGNVSAAVRSGRGLYEVTYVLWGLSISAPTLVLFGILLGRESIWLLLACGATVCADLRLLALARKKHQESYGDLSLHSRKEAYINTTANDSAAGKDIRIYHLRDWFLEKYDQSLGEMEKTFRHIHHWYLFRNVSNALLTLLRNSFVYLFLLYRLIQGEVTAAQFVYYIGLVNTFTLHVEYVVRYLMMMNNVSMTMSYIREFLSWEDDWNRGEGMGKECLEQMKGQPAQLTLRNLSFTYPGNEKPTLDHIDLTIRSGEKLALLGLNGAGKTTLVKLVCGFYHPTEGEILLNGIPIDRFEREEYYSMISVLFQDDTLLPLSLRENLTGQEQEHTDQELLAKALELSGFAERYQRLPKKGDSLLVREVHGEAVDFSGGEKQKMLFARALYKQSPLMILDEPTAALDPIAENELYQHYGESMKASTSIFISHRLSSTRFCDRIVLLEDGHLIEQGTHQELMDLNRRYAELFRIQSQYYQEEQKQEELRRAFGDAGQEGGM